MKEHQRQTECGVSPATAQTEDVHDTLAATQVMKAKALKHLRHSLRRSPGAEDVPCCVTDGLFVGGIGAARNLAVLRALGISHVVNASPLVPCFHKAALRYCLVPVFDDAGEDIAQFFDSTNRYIARGRRKGAVLVHCFAGQSRSVALLLAYLVAREEMTVDAALALIRTTRPAAQPNSGFMSQLRDYETTLRRTVSAPDACSTEAPASLPAPPHRTAHCASDSGTRWWKNQAAGEDSAPQSPCMVSPVSSSGFPFEERASLRRASGSRSSYSLSPQSSYGGRTPVGGAGRTTSAWDIPVLELSPGASSSSDSPCSSPEVASPTLAPACRGDLDVQREVPMII